MIATLAEVFGISVTYLSSGGGGNRSAGEELHTDDLMRRLKELVARSNRAPAERGMMEIRMISPGE